jgi:hypothetical protein
MEEFYIDVELSQGITRIQVDEVPPEQWDMPFTPQFIIEFHNSNGFITLTLQLEQGNWYDRNTRVSDDDTYLRYTEPDPDARNPDYQSPLSESAIRKIGQAIGRHMVVHLTAYMGLFIPVFREPTFN